MTLPLLDRIEISPGQWVSGEHATLTQWTQALDLAIQGKATQALQRHIARVLVRRAVKIGARDGEPLFAQLRQVGGYYRSMNQSRRDRRTKCSRQFSRCWIRGVTNMVDLPERYTHEQLAENARTLSGTGGAGFMSGVGGDKVKGEITPQPYPTSTSPEVHPSAGPTPTGQAVEFPTTGQAVEFPTKWEPGGAAPTSTPATTPTAPAGNLPETISHDQILGRGDRYGRNSSKSWGVE
jgi:hypothetical protein